MRTKTRLASLLALVVLLGACSRSAEDHVEAGKKFVAQKNLTEAALSFRKALQVNSSNADAWRQLGLVLLQQRKVYDGYQALNRAAELDPKNIEVRIDLANLALAAYVGDPQKPAVLWERLQRLATELDGQPAGRRPAARVKSYLAILGNKPEEALRLLEAEKQKEPLDAEMTGLLIQAYFGTNADAPGEALATEWIASHPDQLPMYDLLYRHYAEKGKPAEGEKVLLEKIARSPKQAGPVLQLAAHYVRNNNPSSAQQTLARLMDPAQGYAYGPLAVGDFHASRNQPDLAAAAYRKGIESDWDHRDFYRKKLARLEFSRGNRAEAKALLDAVLKDKPSDAEAVTLMQGLVLGEGDPKNAQSAVATLRSLAERSPDRADGWRRLALAQEATGDVDGAMDSTRRALSADRTDQKALLIRARLTATKGDAAAAIAQTNEILQVWPEDTEARVLKTKLLLAQGRTSEARADLRELEKAAPQLPSVQVLQALMAAADGRAAAAEAQLRKLYKPGDAESRDALVRVLQLQRKSAEAVSLLEAEVKAKPDRAQLRQQLAEAHLAAGKPEAALEQYREIVAHDDAAVTPRLLMGYVLMALNRNGEAASVLSQAMQKEPKNAKALFLYAQSLERQNKTAEALAGYRQVLAVEPSNALAQNNIAFLLADTGGDLNEAQQLASRAMQASNNAPVFMDTLGYIYLKQRKTDLALQTFQSLVQKDPENSTYRFHLGLAMAEKGQRAEARDEMEKALRRSQDPQERQKIQESISKLGA